MKIQKNLLTTLCVMAGILVHAQGINIQPTPQQVKVTTEIVELKAIGQIYGENEANKHAIKALKKRLADKLTNKTGIPIFIGERGDKAVRKFQKFIPKHEEGYFLRITPEEIVLAGNDEQGTFYAYQTFNQLLNDNRLPVTEIIDYPEIRYRGVVEGF